MLYNLNWIEHCLPAFPIPAKYFKIWKLKAFRQRLIELALRAMSIYLHLTLPSSSLLLLFILPLVECCFTVSFSIKVPKTNRKAFIRKYIILKSIEMPLLIDNGSQHRIGCYKSTKNTSPQRGARYWFCPSLPGFIAYLHLSVHEYTVLW